MSEGTAAAAAGTVTATTTTTDAPWYAAQNNAEFTGYVQSRGLDKKTAAEAVFETYKAHHEAQQMISRLTGTPDKDRIIIKPKADAPPEEWNTYWQKNGKPADAKEYGFENLKFADGDAPDDNLRNMLTSASFKANLSKDQASAVAKDVLDWIAKTVTDEETVDAAAKQEAFNKLKTSWGANFDAFQWAADRAYTKLAQQSGLSPEQATKGMKALTDSLGRAEAMQMLLAYSQATGEDRFVTGGSHNGTRPMTREQAKAKLAELKMETGPDSFGARVMRGEPNARAEWDALTAMATGQAA